jgi:hypothetical protein
LAGKVQIDFLYDNALSFSEGLACVKYKGRWGYINHNGEWIIKPIFKQAGSFENGLAWVESDKFSGYISKTGRQILP